jgi:hypothetical protein
LTKKMIFVVVVLLALSVLFPASALAASDGVMSPMFTYISSVDSNLSISSSGTATVSASIICYSSVDSTSVSSYLQRYSGGTWNTIKSWSGSDDDATANMYGTYAVTSGYNYRVRSYFYAYVNGSVVESTSRTTGTLYY